MKTHQLLILAPLIALSSACSDSDSTTVDTTGSAENDGLTTQDTNGADIIEPDSSVAVPGNDGNNGTAPLSGNVSALGYINGSYDSLDDATAWSAQFFQSPSAFPASSLGEEIASASVSDQCEVLETVLPPIDTDSSVDPGNLPFIPETVSAGEVLTITSQAGTYASLTGQTMFGFLIYQTTDGVPVAGPMPTGMTIDIPGSAGGFPALSTIVVPRAAPIEFAADGASITWTGAGEEGASVNILLAAIPGGNVLAPSFIECDLIDDGAHVLADGLLPEGAVEFSIFLGTRSVTRVEQSGDALLILSTESEGFLQRN